MICVQCKNEKWDKDVCPHCGLTEKEALLRRADFFWKNGQNLSAVEFYDKVLSRDPENDEVLKRKANCLYLEAAATRDNSLFKKADELFSSILKKDWGWEQGYQLRIDLYFYFGKLDLLAAEYGRIAGRNGPEEKRALEIVKVIELTKKFKESPPQVSADLGSSDGWGLLVKSFWPLIIVLPLLLWLAAKISASSHARDDSNMPGFFFVMMMILATIVVVIYVCMRLYKKNQRNEKEGNQIA